MKKKNFLQTSAQQVRYITKANIKHFFNPPLPLAKFKALRTRNAPLTQITSFTTCFNQDVRSTGKCMCLLGCPAGICTGCNQYWIIRTLHKDFQCYHKNRNKDQICGFTPYIFTLDMIPFKNRSIPTYFRQYINMLLKPNHTRKCQLAIQLATTHLAQL